MNILEKSISSLLTLSECSVSVSTLRCRQHLNWKDSRAVGVPFSPVSQCRIMGVSVVVVTGRKLGTLLYNIAGGSTGREIGYRIYPIVFFI